MVKSSGESSGMGFYLMWWLSLMVDFNQVPLGQSTSTGTTALSIYAQFCSGMGFYLMWWLSLMGYFDQVPPGTKY